MDRPGRQFLFRLASHLRQPVWRIESDMPAIELREWDAWEETHPFPDFWLAVGMILAEIRNGLRNKGKAVSALDIFPFLKSPKRQQTAEEMERIAKQWLS